MKIMLVTATQGPISNFRGSLLFQSLFFPSHSPAFSPVERRGGVSAVGEWLAFRATGIPSRYNMHNPSRYDMDLLVCCNNTKGLGEIYDYALRELTTDADIVVFVHDDVSIEDAMFQNKLTEQLATNDIVGICGAKTMTLREPALWHIMADRPTWSGYIGNIDAEGKRWMVNFGGTPQPCVVLDGMLLAVKRSAVIAAKISFDPQFTFHCYDIDFCLSAHKAGLKMTTAPIWAIHGSPGLKHFNDPVFKDNQKKFVTKWAAQYLSTSSTVDS